MNPSGRDIGDFSDKARNCFSCWATNNLRKVEPFDDLLSQRLLRNDVVWHDVLPPTLFSIIAAPISSKIAGSSMVAGMVPLEQVRQFDAKCVSENGNDDPV